MTCANRAEILKLCQKLYFIDIFFSLQAEHNDHEIVRGPGWSQLL